MSLPGYPRDSKIERKSSPDALGGFLGVSNLKWYMYHLRFGRLGGVLGSILESLGHPWRGIFHKKVELFSDPVLGWLLVPLFKRFFIDFV